MIREVRNADSSTRLRPTLIDVNTLMPSGNQRVVYECNSAFQAVLPPVRALLRHRRRQRRKRLRRRGAPDQRHHVAARLHVRTGPNPPACGQDPGSTSGQRWSCARLHAPGRVPRCGVHAEPRPDGGMMFKDEQGTTLIEALMAITLLVLGVIGTFTTFDGVRQLGDLGEKKQSATRYAQSEIEAMRNMGWSNLKLNATPAAASDSRGTVAGGSYAPPRAAGASSQCLWSSPPRPPAARPRPASAPVPTPGPTARPAATSTATSRSSHDLKVWCGTACGATGTDQLRDHGRGHRQRARTLRSRRSSARRS